MTNHTNFAFWLRRRYARWRYGPFSIQRVLHPERRISGFSRWLGIDLDLLTRWMSGEQPDPDSDKFKNAACKLGLNAYDCLGLPRPIGRTRRLSFDVKMIGIWRMRHSD